jgi:hypothetical protein
MARMVLARLATEGQAPILPVHKIPQVAEWMREVPPKRPHPDVLAELRTDSRFAPLFEAVPDRQCGRLLSLIDLVGRGLGAMSGSAQALSGVSFAALGFLVGLDSVRDHGEAS